LLGILGQPQALRAAGMQRRVLGQTGMIRSISARLKWLEAQSPQNQLSYRLQITFVNSKRDRTGSRVLELAGVTARTYDLDPHGKEIVCR
jgi:hypothetical protein